jgi:glycosyltransferase involved in cell wall biosynthesis
MNVTFIGILPPIKSISPYCFNLAKNLSDEVNLEFIGFKAILPDAFYRGGPEEKNIEFQEIKNAQINNIISWYNPLTWIIAGLKAKGDLVHIQHWALYSSVMYCIIIPLLKLRGKKIVISVHNITPHEVNKFIRFLFKVQNKIIFPFGDGFIIHNTRNKEKFLKLYNVNDEKISIIPHGMTKPVQIKDISKNEARKHLGLPLNKKIILFFGYFYQYKGLDVMLQSFKMIIEKMNGVLLLIAGQPLKSWRKYSKMIEKLNLKNHIFLRLEYIPEPEIKYYFQAADIVALPYKEPFDTHGGLGALALSYKKPLIVTDIGGLPEYVYDKRAISKPEDTNGLSKNIIRVLKDEHLLKKLADDADDIAKELTWDKIAKKTLRTYKKVLSSS